MKNAAVLAIAALAVCFPAQLVKAIREQDGEKAQYAKYYACLCFGTMMLLLAMLVNS